MGLDLMFNYKIKGTKNVYLSDQYEQVGSYQMEVIKTHSQRNNPNKNLNNFILHF